MPNLTGTTALFRFIATNIAPSLPVTLRTGAADTTVSNMTELQAALDAAPATGDYIIDLNDGDYDGLVVTSAHQFTDEVTIRSVTRNNNPTDKTHLGGGARLLNVDMRDFQNIGLQNVDLYRPKTDPAIKENNERVVALRGAWSGLRIERCEGYSDTIEKTPRGENWPAIVDQADGNEGRNFTLRQNWFHDASRAVVISISNTTLNNQNYTVENYCESCYVCGIQKAGGSNLTIAFNYQKDFFSVDVAYDTSTDGQFTATTANSVTLAAGPGVSDRVDAYIHMNIKSQANNEVIGVIASYDPNTRVCTTFAPLTRIPDGTERFRLRDPSEAHQSAMPMTPDNSSDQYNIKLYGNIYAGTDYRSEYCQIAGLKLDDKGNGSGTRYRNCQVYGNLLVGSQSISMEISSGDEDCMAYGNTIVWDEGWVRRNSPATRVTGDLPVYAAWENNVSAGLLPQGVNVGVGRSSQNDWATDHSARNIRMGKTDGNENPSLTDLFVGPSFNDVVSDPIGTFALNGTGAANNPEFGQYGCGATGGFVTWPANFDTLPSMGVINGTLPNRNPGQLNIPNTTGPASTLLESTLIPIGGVSDGTGVWCIDPVTLEAVSTVEVRILEADGTTVVTDWTVPTWASGKSSVEINAGQQIRLRATSPASGDLDFQLRVGTNGGNWNVAEGAIYDVDVIIGQSENAIGMFINRSGPYIQQAYEAILPGVDARVIISPINSDEGTGGAVEDWAVTQANIDAGRINPGAVAYANAKHVASGGRPLLLVDHTRSGTSMDQMMDDDNTSRTFDDDKAVADYVLATYGTALRPHMIYLWSSAEASVSRRLVEERTPHFIGRNADGSAYDFTTGSLEHCLVDDVATDAADEATRAVGLWPRRNSLGQGPVINMMGAHPKHNEALTAISPPYISYGTRSDGSRWTGMSSGNSMEPHPTSGVGAIQSRKDFIAALPAEYRGKVGPGVHHVLFGDYDAAGAGLSNGQSIIHPAVKVPEGQPYMAESVALTMAYFQDYISTIPEILSATNSSDGTTITLTLSDMGAGWSYTTQRAVEGETVASPRPHQILEGMGFTVFRNADDYGDARPLHRTDSGAAVSDDYKGSLAISGNTITITMVNPFTASENASGAGIAYGSNGAYGAGLLSGLTDYNAHLHKDHIVSHSSNSDYLFGNIPLQAQFRHEVSGIA